MTDEFELVGLPEDENDFVQLAFFGFRRSRDRDGDPGMDGHGIHRPHFGGGRVRHVRTPEGAQYYDQPIGSIITRDTINRVNREKGRLGLKPPKGAITAGEHPQDHGHPALHQIGMPKTDHTTVAPPHAAPSTPHGKGPVTPAQAAVRAKLQANAPKPGALAKRMPGSTPTGPKAPGSPAIHTPAGHKPAADLKQEVKQIKPTIDGPLKFSLGGKEFGAPEGSTVYHLKQNPDALAFVKTNDGTVHVFNHNGEVTVPDHVQPILQKRFASKLKEDDPNYLAGKFTNEGKVPQLAEAKPGAELHDKNGPQFQAQPDGSWQHTGLGTTHDSSELDPHYKSGELQYKPAGGADLSSMDQAGFKQAVRKQTSLQFANPKTGEVHDLTRGDDKLWHSTDKNQAPLSDTSLYYLRKNLSISDDPQMAKDVRKATKAAAKPAGAKRPAARKPKAETPKVDAPKERKPKTDTPKERKPKVVIPESGEFNGEHYAKPESKKPRAVAPESKDASKSTPRTPKEPKKTFESNEGRHLPRDPAPKTETPKTEEPKKPREPKAEEPKAEAPKPKKFIDTLPDLEVGHHVKYIKYEKAGGKENHHAIYEKTGADEYTQVDEHTGKIHPGSYGKKTSQGLRGMAAFKNAAVVHHKTPEEAKAWRAGLEAKAAEHAAKPHPHEYEAGSKVGKHHVGDPLALEHERKTELEKAAAGSVVRRQGSTNSGSAVHGASTDYTKGEDGLWGSEGSPHKLTDAQLAKHLHLNWVKGHPKDREEPKAETPKPPRPPKPEAPAAEQPAPDHFPDGHVFGHHSELAQLEPGRHITASVPTPSGSAAYLPDRHYVKHEDGLFHSTDHSEIPPKTAEQIKHAHSAWDHWKVTLDPKHADAQHTEPPHTEPPHTEAPQAAEPHVEAPHAPETHAPEAPPAHEPHVEAPAAHEAPAAQPEKPPFHILPESERGHSGDGYFPGTHMWGKYGASGVMIRHKDENGQERFLLVQRGHGVSSNVGKWQLPGGALEQHESPYQGTARETHEELQASHEYLASLKPVGEHVFEHATGWKYTNIAADAPAKFEPHVDGTETGDAKWFTRAELQKLKDDGHLNPPFAAALDHILGKFKNDEPAAPKTEAPARAPETAAEGLTHRPHLASDAEKIKVDKPIDTANWTKLENDHNEPHGSNPGGHYLDENGDRWYVKETQSDDHARNEALASALYRAAGIDVPEVRLAHVNGQLGVASKYVPGAKQDLHSHLHDEEYLKKIHEGFASDAWLANWDVAGLTFDNIVTGEDGNPHRIDTGGTLLYRATGPAKGEAFAHTAGELGTFKDPYMSEQGHRLFQTMTPEAEKASAQRVANVKPEEINRLVDEAGFSGAKAEELKTKLASRREHIMDTYGVSPKEPRPPQAQAPSAPEPTPSPAPAHAAPSGELKAGDKIPHEQWLHDAEGSSQVHYHKNDGSTTLYTKHPSQDTWISPNGTPVRSSSLGQPNRLPKLTFHSKPEHAAEDVTPAPEPTSLHAPEVQQSENLAPSVPAHLNEGDLVTPEHLAAMEHGDRFTVEHPGHWLDGKTYQKDVFGGWKSTEDSTTLVNSAVHQLAVGGKLKYAGNALEPQHTPDATPAEPAVHNPLSTRPEGLGLSNKVTAIPHGASFQIDTGTASITTSRIEEAIMALEAHSSPSPKYALKKIDGYHPIKEQSDLFTKLAKEEFPGLKPKQALIKMLKRSIGKDEAMAAPSGADILFKQKKGDQTFKASEVEHAIKALESSDKVQVKSVLAAAESPLSKLDQHELIGFIKDKKEQKAKYIEFLKKKLDRTEPPQFSEAFTGESAPETPLTLKVFKHGDALTADDLAALHPGEKVTRDSGMFKHHYTKQADDNFRNDITGIDRHLLDMQQFAHDGSVTYHDPAGRQLAGAEPTPPTPSPEPISSAQPGQVIGSHHEIGEAPAGHVFHMHNPDAAHAHYDLTKNGDGTLEHPQYGAISASSITQEALDKGWLSHGTHDDLSHAQEAGFRPGHQFTPTDKNAFDALPAGQMVHYHPADVAADGGVDYVSNGHGGFTNANSSSTYPLHAASFHQAIHHGMLYAGKHEDHAVAPAPKPEPGDKLNEDSIKRLEVGDVVQLEDSNQHYTKRGPDDWQSSVSGNHYHESTLTNSMDSYDFHYVGPEHQDAAPAEPTHEAISAAEHANPGEAPTTNASGIAPGKWSTKANSKAYMVVHSDGTGTYVNSKGEAKAITAAKVKGNHAAGMTHYHGEVHDYPRPGSAASVAAGASKKITNVEKLADGTYFAGIGPNATMYEVSGDKVKIHDHGNVTEKNLSFLKTKFLKGQITDQYGNSVLPKGENYGSAKFFGGDTTVPELVRLRGEMDKVAATGDIKGYFQQIKDKYDASHAGWSPISSLPGHLAAWLSSQGVKVDNVTLTQRAQQLHGDTGVEAKFKTLHDHLPTMLDGVHYDPIEEGSAKKLFEFDSAGRAIMPASLVRAGYNNEPWDISSITSLLKQHADGFAGGGVIGQHTTKLDKSAKRAWLKAFNRGDFKTMFELEHKSAHDAGKPLPNAAAHPGHAANPETHKVEWGAPVLGEVPVGDHVDGNWSALSMNASQEELANYLIAAKMQHPTFLTVAERRDWVKAHRQGLPWEANQLSLLAKTRADSGAQPLSTEPTWTDNLQPAKSYDHLFDSTPFPQSWTTSTASDWVHDQVGKPEFRDMIRNYAEDLKNSHGATYATTATNLMLSDPANAIDPTRAKAIAKSWFQKKQQAWEIEDAIPKYSLDPAHQLAGSGSHALAVVDHHDKQYVFKPSPDGSDYRAELEHGANEIGRAFGFPSAVSNVTEFNGQKGLMQDRHNSVSDLTGFNDVSTLTPPQLRAITQEHLLDFLLNNDNSRAKHFLINPDGGIHGIDKSRAFHYGMQEGTLDHFGLPHGAVHEKIYDAIRTGKIDKATADNIYLAMRERAARMEKAPNEPFSKLLDDALKNREQSHFGDFSSAEVKKRFFDRKDNLVGEVDSMWKKIYKDAGHGELPEPPKHPLGEHHSGLHDERWHAQIHDAHGLGATTHISTPGVLDGHVTGYSTLNADGTRNTHAKFHIAGDHADRVTGHLETLAPGSVGPVDNIVLPPQAGWKQALHQAGINNNYQITHSGTIEPAFEDKFRKAWDEVKGDIQYLATNDPTDSIIHMPSGKDVHKEYLDHYKAMLSHWDERGQKMDDAIKNKSWLDPYDEFTNYATRGIAPNEATYTNQALGQKYIALNHDKYLHIDNGKVRQVSAHELSQEILSGQNGWIKDAKADPAQSHWYSVKRVPAFQMEGNLQPNGEVLLNGHKVQDYSKGYPGEMFEIKLPGGALLHYQNRDVTDTAWVQHNTFRITMPNTHQSSDISKHMQEVDKFLTEMGLPTQEADHRHVEASYWRKMANIFLHQNREKTYSPTKKAAYKSVHDDLMAELRKHGFDSMLKSENGYESAYQHAHDYLHHTPSAGDFSNSDTMRRYEIPTMLAEKFPGIDEELAFYRQMFGKAFGDKVVENWVENKNFMPHYQEYIQGGKKIAGGLPYHERFDVNPEDLKKHKKLLAHQLHGSGQSFLDRLKLLGHSGSLLSTEARLRVLGEWFGGSSSQDDQSYGSAHGVYTNIEDVPSYGTGLHVWFDAAPLMSRVETYSYPGDIFGSFHHKDWAPIDPEYALKHFTNETMVYDGLPIQNAKFIAFKDDYAYGSQAAVTAKQKIDTLVAALEANGITEINGKPLRDVIVDGSSLSAVLLMLQGEGF